MQGSYCSCLLATVLVVATPCGGAQGVATIKMTARSPSYRTLIVVQLLPQVRVISGQINGWTTTVSEPFLLAIFWSLRDKTKEKIHSRIDSPPSIPHSSPVAFPAQFGNPLVIGPCLKQCSVARCICQLPSISSSVWSFSESGLFRPRRFRAISMA